MYTTDEPAVRVGDRGEHGVFILYEYELKTGES